MPPIPQESDFPQSLTLSITPPSTPRSSNVLLILHGLGDTIPRYISFASALHLPETTCITIQAPHPLPFLLEGFHWGDDLVFDGDTIDPDPGFKRATRLLVHDIVISILIQKLGYRAREILILGYAQGASVALSAALEFSRLPSQQPSDLSPQSEPETEFGGVISLGGVVPISVIREDGRRGKSRTPVLIAAGQGPGSAVSDMGIRRTKGEFEFVEVVRWARKGDGMPRNREEMLPIMQFFARRLRSRSGVPEGSVEIT